MHNKSAYIQIAASLSMDHSHQDNSQTRPQKETAMSELNTVSAPETENIKVEDVNVDTEANRVSGNTFDVSVPEAFRSAAEQVVTQSREAYERSKDTMEDTVEAMEASIDKTGQGIAAINRKIFDIAQVNLNSTFDFARALASAKNPSELAEIQAQFVRRQFETFSAQAQEFSDLSTQIATETAEPVKAYVERSMETLKTT